MTSVDASTESSPEHPSAGQMLRAAREAQGLHLAVLSVKLKVSVRQLEALEADQHDVLKGLAFERALAQAVCRQLRLDPAPVLAALPQPAHKQTIAPVAIESRRSSVPLSTRSGAAAGKGLSRQVLVLAGLMLLGAAALIWWPNNAHNEAEEAQDATQAAVPLGQASDPVESPESEASAEVPATPPASEPAAAKAPVASASSQEASRPSASPLLVRMQADAWVEVRDSQGQMLLKRTVKAGETVQLSSSAPLFIYVGKADSAELRWQGQLVDLKPHTQNNEARLQIKP